MKKRATAAMAVGAALVAAAAAWQVTGGVGPVAHTSAAPAPAAPALMSSSPASRALAGPPAPVPATAQRFVIDPQASEASYHVGETFFLDNTFKVAMGVTHGILGDIYVDRAHPDQSRIGTITINVNQFTSDSSRRDNAIRSRWLESNTYPTATFTPTSIEGLPKTYAAGQTIPVKVTGDLTVHNVTKPATFTGTLKLSRDTLTGTMHSTVLMKDFGFDPPSIVILQTEDKAVLEFQFTAHPLGA